MWKFFLANISKKSKYMQCSCHDESCYVKWQIINKLISKESYVLILENCKKEDLDLSAVEFFNLFEILNEFHQFSKKTEMINASCTKPNFNYISFASFKFLRTTPLKNLNEISSVNLMV